MKFCNSFDALAEDVEAEVLVKPIRMVLMPRIRSKSLMMGMLPPRRTANGCLPKALANPCSAA